MALISGINPSGKLFDVVDEDGDVLGSFDTSSEACDCARAAPWWAGQVNIRRDRALDALQHTRIQELKRLDRLAFDYAC